MLARIRSMFILTKVGVQNCHFFVFEESSQGIKFWESLGWTKQVELMKSQLIIA